MAFVVKTANLIHDKYAQLKERISDDNQQEETRKNLYVDFIENQIPNWQEMVEGEIKKTNKNYSHTLGGGLFGLTNKAGSDICSNDREY